MLHSALLLAAGGFSVGSDEIKTAIAAFLVGIVVGITGMGGGALMTPALIFLGVGNASAVVTADLAASAVSRSTGALVHWRQGSPNLKLAMWLVIGSVPMAFIGPAALNRITGGTNIDTILLLCIGFALLFAAAAYAFRLLIQLRRVTSGRRLGPRKPVIRPVPTLLVGALGGLLVGVTSVGSGSVIMIALLMLYPTLSPVKLVGTDLVQAVPLVLAAAIANVLVYGLQWGIVIPLIIGSVPGSVLGARLAPRVPASLIRRAIVVVLTVSGLALLDKSGWAPLGSGPNDTHPVLIAVIGLAMVVLVPLVWGLIRRTRGLPMFGKPTVAQLENPATARGAAGVPAQVSAAAASSPDRGPASASAATTTSPSP